jgi:hypothetical protein
LVLGFECIKLLFQIMFLPGFLENKVKNYVIQNRTQGSSEVYGSGFW